jgi:glycosyltransferase involved in cell wall biosynthesis
MDRMHRPIRVCFLIDRLRPAGTESQLVALIRHLNRRRVEPYLCLLDGEDDLSRSLEPPDCPVLRLGVHSLHRRETVGAAWRLARFLRRERIDVVQVYFVDSTYLGVPVARLAGVPYVVRTRNNAGYWITPLHRWLGWFYHRFADVTVANCEASRRSVIAEERPSPRRVLVLENGVDLSRFPRGHSGATTAPRPGGPAVGVVANLRPIKGLDILVRAAVAICAVHPDVTFHIAGEGEQRPELEQLVADLGLANCFHLPGTVFDIPAFLARLDVAVLPSHSEGMSNALLEYMSAGKAIVATRVGDNARLIEDGRHGLLVVPGSPTALAAAVRRLLEDPGLARRLGRAARRRVEECYSREAMVRRFEAFYEGLVGRARRPSPRVATRGH